MTISKEYWNIPKSDDVLSIPQGTNLTVFVDHAEKATYFGLEVTVWTALLSLFVAVISIFMACKANNINKTSLRPFMHLEQEDSSLTLEYEGEGDIECVMLRLDLKNIGNGPLIVRRLDSTIGGQPLINDNKRAVFKPQIEIADYASNIFRKAIGDHGDGKSWMNQNPWPVELIVYPKGTGIEAGQKKTIVSFPIRKTYETSENKDNFYSQIKVYCEYEDIYGKVFYFKES